MTTYKNTFYNPTIPGSQPTISTDAKPVEYMGCLIFHRIKSQNKSAECFDIVKNGECVGMYAGIHGAKERIDIINKEKL